MEALTAARLRNLLHYDPETGIFTRRATGAPVGSLNDKGYIRIRLGGRDHKAHRLAWLYMTGAWPPIQVDHENRTPDDNRWGNLRAATFSQNAVNKISHKPSASGFKGVYWHQEANCWRAELTLAVAGRRRKKVLGYFHDPAEADELRELAARMVWGERYLDASPNA